MKKYCLLILLALLVYSCGENDSNFLKPKKVENLVEIKNGVYTEWYPGKKNIKFQGPQDNNHLRNGKWVFFSEGGEELSITFYENGKREGFTIVKYPNGRLHYRGEYQDDKIVGDWITYNEKGKVTSEQSPVGLEGLVCVAGALVISVQHAGGGTFATP